jgi:hypothetical protein
MEAISKNWLWSHIEVMFCDNCPKCFLIRDIKVCLICNVKIEWNEGGLLQKISNKLLKVLEKSLYNLKNLYKSQRSRKDP